MERRGRPKKIFKDDSDDSRLSSSESEAEEDGDEEGAFYRL